VPVSVIAEGPMVLLVPASSPAKTLDDFVKLARAKPGGTLRRAGHTEASIDLARLAGPQPDAQRRHPGAGQLLRPLLGL